MNTIRNTLNNNTTNTHDNNNNNNNSNTSIGDEIYNLWMEYETGSTLEARLVKDFDKFEMIVQADEYERGIYTSSVLSTI